MERRRALCGGTIDAAIGLTHLGAREYDPQLGRFISVDAIIDHARPQQMNGYSYAGNSPATLSDPTGLFECDKCDGSEHPSDFDPLPKKKPAPSGPDIDVRGGYDDEGNYRVRINGYTLPKARYNLHAMLIHIRKNFNRVHEEPGDLGDLLKIIRLVASAYADVGFKGSESHYVHSQIQDDATVAAMAMDVDRSVDGNLTRAQVALLETISMGAGVVLGTRGLAAGAAGRTFSFKRWQVGDDVYAPTAFGREPKWSTVRGRFWKNEAARAEGSGEWSEANLTRMRKGLAPQRYNADKGGTESMELSHEPIPARLGGRAFVPRWPQDHARVDVYRRPGY